MLQCRVDVDDLRTLHQFDDPAASAMARLLLWRQRRQAHDIGETDVNICVRNGLRLGLRSQSPSGAARSLRDARAQYMAS